MGMSSRIWFWWPLSTHANGQPSSELPPIHLGCLVITDISFPPPDPAPGNGKIELREPVEVSFHAKFDVSGGTQGPPAQLEPSESRPQPPGWA